MLLLLLLLHLLLVLLLKQLRLVILLQKLGVLLEIVILPGIGTSEQPLAISPPRQKRLVLRLQIHEQAILVLYVDLHGQRRLLWRVLGGQHFCQVLFRQRQIRATRLPLLAGVLGEFVRLGLAKTGARLHQLLGLVGVVYVIGYVGGAL